VNLRKTLFYLQKAGHGHQKAVDGHLGTFFKDPISERRRKKPAVKEGLNKLKTEIKKKNKLF